jgi:hypothetical protein
MCACSACTTGKCQCPECRPGPGIDHERDRALVSQIRRDIAVERIRIREQRAPSIERQRVRRWGDIVPTGRTENREEIRNELDE